MNVFANTVVSLTFKLFDARDTLIEEAREPITYLHGGYSGIFPSKLAWIPVVWGLFEATLATLAAARLYPE